MKSTFDLAMRLLLRHEGGFVNHPKDPGGMTNLGVTKAVWDAHTGKPATEADAWVNVALWLAEHAGPGAKGP
jgi:lysozyme family protein